MAKDKKIDKPVAVKAATLTDKKKALRAKQIKVVKTIKKDGKEKSFDMIVPKELFDKVLFKDKRYKLA